jgi:tetratricopeptide (TPR) repeat protein
MRVADMGKHIQGFSVHDLLRVESTSAIVRKEEIVRSNLTAASEALLPRIRSLKNAPEAEWSRFGSIYNHAGLIQFSAGFVERAERLCVHAVNLFVSMACAHDQPSWLVNAVQPAINLGRLASAYGRPDEALRIFKEFQDWMTSGRPITMGGMTCDARHRDGVCAIEPSIDEIVTNVYVFDTVKTLLLAERYEDVLAFRGASNMASSKAAVTAIREAALLEGRARALTGLGQYSAAADIFQKLAASTALQNDIRLNCYILAADVHRRGGMIHEARRVLAWVHTRLASVRVETREGAVAPAKSKAVEARRILYQLALAQLALGEHDHALENGLAGLGLSATIGDEVATIKFLLVIHLAARECRPADERHWRTRLHAITEATDYRLERALSLLHLASSDHGDTSCAAAASESAALLLSLPLPAVKPWRERALAIAAVTGQLATPVAIKRSPPIEELFDALMDVRSADVPRERSEWPRFPPAVSHTAGPS